MSKKKKQLARFKSELHTISPLPLEMVEERLHELESKTLAVSTHYVDQDHMALMITYQDDSNSKIAEVIGKLSRWEGTYTRVNANSRTFTYLEWLDQLLSAARIIGIAVLLFPACGLLGYFIYAESVANLLGLVLSVMASLILVRYFRPIDFSKKQHYRAYKAIDRTMQEIADKLTEDRPDAAPMLEFDGSENSLTRLLQQEKFKHLIVGDDGEVNIV